MERLSILYASALFNLAVEKNAVDEFYGQAALVRDALQEKDAKRVLVHPRITAAEKRKLFKEAFEGHINSDLLGLLYLAADKNREAYVIPALSRLMEDIDRYNNKITAKVLSAAPYSAEQTKTLSAMLSTKLEKQVKIDLSVDPSVIGGPYIYADGCYIDWTVKTRLREMTRKMKEKEM